MEHYIEVGTADSIAAFRSSRRYPLGRDDSSLLKSTFANLLYIAVTILLFCHWFFLNKR